MADPIYYLTQTDLLQLKELLQKLKGTPTRLVDTPSPSAKQTPDIFVAYLAEDVPAMSGIESPTPGNGVAEIYRIDYNGANYSLSSVSSIGSKTVLNISTSVVSSGYVQVNRDKFGNWLIVTGSSGSGGSSSDVNCGCTAWVNAATVNIGGIDYAEVYVTNSFDNVFNVDGLEVTYDSGSDYVGAEFTVACPSE